MTERMLDDTLTATSFAPDAADASLPDRAQVVIVGGGVAGSSIAYHLAAIGITDVVLLERATIASGTSWQAAGLVARVRGSHPMTELSSYGVDLYRGLEEDTGVDVNFRPTGSLTLAETRTGSKSFATRPRSPATTGSTRVCWNPQRFPTSGRWPHLTAWSALFTSQATAP